MESPYNVKTPIMWAGNYLLYKGKVVAGVSLRPYDRPNNPRWEGYAYIPSDLKGMPDNWFEQARFFHWSRSDSQAVIMKHLEDWLNGMINNRTEILDIFLRQI